MRISYSQVRGSGYNARTGNNVAICPGGAKKKNIKKQISTLDDIFLPVLLYPQNEDDRQEDSIGSAGSLAQRNERNSDR